MSKYDVILVLPYLFSDHPSFPEGLIKRNLEEEGYKVGVIEQPKWQDSSSFGILGRPRLFFAVISGPIDSVVLNYTSTRKRRREDLYQKKGNAFFDNSPQTISSKIRPDRTVIVFSNKIRECFKDTSILIGGVEASQRTFAHYDFQSNKIRRSILLDSRADLLVNGMGEKQVRLLAKKVSEGILLKNCVIDGITSVSNELLKTNNTVILPSYEDILKNKEKFMEAYLIERKAVLNKKTIIQQHGNRFIIKYPSMSYTTKDLDFIYGLRYKRKHIKIDTFSPALRMNLFSITSHRGCGGGCSFCSITHHEGKKIISRTEDSIIKEVELLKKHSEWKGVVSDIGGGSAEMYGSDCEVETCNKFSCLFNKKCKNFVIGKRYLNLLNRIVNINGVKKVLVGSGLRYDLLFYNPELLEQIMLMHSGNFLRVAPEHTESAVLNFMQKPDFDIFEKFLNLFNSINKKMKRKIVLSPYLLIGHPGESDKDILEMRKKIKKYRLNRKDVQIFTPTPGTLSTAMYYSGLDSNMNSISVERDIRVLMRRKENITRT